MSGLDIIPLPGHSGMYARRAAVEAWQRAGSPTPTSAGRLYAVQKYYSDGWKARKPGFNPADDPDDESQRLAHVRFVAFDIDPTPDRIRRLSAAGLIRPYSYEPWHWELPDVRSYAIVRSIPSAAGGSTTPSAPPESEEDDMKFLYVDDDGNGKGVWVLLNTRTGKLVTVYEQRRADGWATVWGSARKVKRQEFLNAVDAIQKTA